MKKKILMALFFIPFFILMIQGCEMEGVEEGAEETGEEIEETVD